MAEDAKFEDGADRPIYIAAMDDGSVPIVSSLVQDAVFPVTEMTWRPRERRFALLLNRFRWEDQGRDRHGAERVQSVLAIDHVLKVSSQGIDRSEKDMVLSLLAVEFEPGEDGTGYVMLTLAGDGAIRLAVEALEVSMKDVTRPYKAPSGKAPDHGD